MGRKVSSCSKLVAGLNEVRRLFRPHETASTECELTPVCAPLYIFPPGVLALSPPSVSNCTLFVVSLCSEGLGLAIAGPGESSVVSACA